MKIFLDGSIQGGSGRMLSPGYYKTGHNGAWNATPQVVEQQVYEIMSRGYQVHCHCNGDEASEAFIQAVEKRLTGSLQPITEPPCSTLRCCERISLNASKVWACA